MADRPIIFSGPMVRALLAGRKAVTRRILRPQPHREDGFWHWHQGAWSGDGPTLVQGHSMYEKAPARPGDRLYVRERVQIDGREVNYAADQPAGLNLRGLGYRPSIHMPRWASRMELLVHEVRIERLHAISAADTIAEGVECASCSAMGHSACGHMGCFESRFMFRDLWNAIHGPEAWDDNPWVAAIRFEVERLPPPKREGVASPSTRRATPSRDCTPPL